MNSLSRFLRLPRADQFCFMQAWLLLPVTALALRCTSLQRWQSFLARWTKEPSRAADTAGAVENGRRVPRMVAAAARRSVFRPNCLHRSVVCWWLLRRRGIASELRLGSRNHGEQFEAHAWVECAGEVLNDAGDVHERFAPLERAIVSREVKAP